MPESTRAANAVQIGLGKAREVEVDDHVDGGDVDAAREEVTAHEAPSLAALEVVEDLVALALFHLRVNVETRVAKLRNLLRKKLDSLSAVAKYDRLVNL